MSLINFGQLPSTQGVHTTGYLEVVTPEQIERKKKTQALFDEMIEKARRSYEAQKTNKTNETEEVEPSKPVEETEEPKEDKPVSKEIQETRTALDNAIAEYDKVKEEYDKLPDKSLDHVFGMSNPFGKMKQYPEEYKKVQAAKDKVIEAMRNVKASNGLTYLDAVTILNSNEGGGSANKVNRKRAQAAIDELEKLYPGIGRYIGQLTSSELLSEYQRKDENNDPEKAKMDKWLDAWNFKPVLA